MFKILFSSLYVWFFYYPGPSGRIRITRTQFLYVSVLVLIVLYSTASFFVNKTDSVAPIRVACIGDSITLGSYYTVDLQRRLGSSYDVQEFGVSGATVSLSSDRPYLKNESLQLARGFMPNLVIIMLGTNDASSNSSVSAYRFGSDYAKLVAEFQSFPSKPAIWLVNPPPIYENELNLSNANLVEVVIPSIEEIGKSFRLPVIDIYSSLAGHADYFFDGVHPRYVGADVIAKEVCAAIKSAESS